MAHGTEDGKEPEGLKYIPKPHHNMELLKAIQSLTDRVDILEKQLKK